MPRARCRSRRACCYEKNSANRREGDRRSRKALIHVFFAGARYAQDVRACRARPKAAPDRERPAWSAPAPWAAASPSALPMPALPVTMLDTHRGGAGSRAWRSIGKTYDSMVKRGRLSAGGQGAAHGADPAASLDYSRPGRRPTCIIEAVFENIELKKKIFSDARRGREAGRVLATNTSTLDVDADRSGDPPSAGCHRAALLLAGQRHAAARGGAHRLTAPAAIRTASGSGEGAAQDAGAGAGLLRLHRQPHDGGLCARGRAHGAGRRRRRAQVDGALEPGAWPWASWRCSTWPASTSGVNVHRANADRYPPDPTYYQADFALDAAGRLGQKNGKGYYRYEPGDRTRHDDPEAIDDPAGTRAAARSAAARTRRAGNRRALPVPADQRGLSHSGGRRVRARASDIDVVWCAGYGFPRYRGGPMFYADTIGLKTVLEGMLKYRDQFGPMHWEPAPLLERLVHEGRTLADWDRSARLTRRRSTMNVKDLIAIDVHAHAEVSCRQPADESGRHTRMRPQSISRPASARRLPRPWPITASARSAS